MWHSSKKVCNTTATLMKNKKYIGATTLFVAAGLLIALPTFAQTPPQGTMPAQTGNHAGWSRNGGKMGMGHGVRGNVTAINGNSITVTSTNPKDSTTQTFTVDATNAKVTKDNAASSISSIVVGDTIMVQGTVNGTTVTAKNIFDGKMILRGQADQVGQDQNKQGNTFTGNGQPLVGGTVTSISGSIVSITNRGNTTFTVDATNAKVTKQGTASALSNISVGDTLLVQGAVNGNSITANSIEDQGVATAPQAVSNTTTAPAQNNPGFFGRIKGFFSRFF